MIGVLDILVEVSCTKSRNWNFMPHFHRVCHFTSRSTNQIWATMAPKALYWCHRCCHLGAIAAMLATCCWCSDRGVGSPYKCGKSALTAHTHCLPWIQMVICALFIVPDHWFPNPHQLCLRVFHIMFVGYCILGLERWIDLKKITKQNPWLRFCNCSLLKDIWSEELTWSLLRCSATVAL